VVFFTLLIKTERSQAISSIDRNDGSSARTASSRRLSPDPPLIFAMAKVDLVWG